MSRLFFIFSITMLFWGSVQSPISNRYYNDFTTLKRYFNQDSLYSHNIDHTIPKAIAQKYIHELLDTPAYVSTVYALDYFPNKAGYFFLVKIICGAGGYCEMFDLLSFNKEYKFVGAEIIGNTNMEYGTTLSFEYHLISDTLSIYEIETDNDSIRGRDFSHKIIKLIAK